jgi:hypothetical protein
MRKHKTILTFKMKLIITNTYIIATASVVYWSAFLATNPEVLGSIPGATRFSEK